MSIEKQDPLLRSADFDEVYQYAKKLMDLGYEVKLTANNGQIVRIVNNTCVVRFADGEQGYKFTNDDLYNHATWGIRWRKKKGPWKGLVHIRREAHKIFPQQEEE